MHIACKRTLYKLGWYQFKPPPCLHPRTDAEWIEHIDRCNGWLPNGGRRPFFMPAWIRKLGVELKDPQFYDAGSLLEP